MIGAAEIFESHRPQLFGVAYRMVGTRPDAEDILQDAYLRWHQTSTKEIKSPVAFLVTVTTRLCLDHLRGLKQDRGQYGETCPPHAADDPAPSPEMQCELADEVADAFLAVIERLGPDERAVFLLHEIFDYDYDEVAALLGKSEPSCRQIVHRARCRVRDSQARFAMSADSRERLLKKFFAAVASGDRWDVKALVEEQVDVSRLN